MRLHTSLGTPRLVLFVALVAAAACGPFRRGSSEDDALIYFTNGSIEQAAVYAVSGGEQQRIGTVSAGRTDTLRVPASMVTRGQVNVVVRLLARSDTPSSGNIAVGPGSRHEVRLTPDGRQITVLPGS
jgi:hypothetical protein